MLGLASCSLCPRGHAQEPPQRISLPANFRAADATDYGLSLAGFAGALVAVVGFRSGGGARWDAPILFDDAARDALVAESYDGRRRYDLASNVAVYGSMAWAAFDAFGLALALDRNPRVAREMFWMDTEAYAVSLLLTNLTKRVALRKRPYARPCATDAKYDPHCGSFEENVSFYSSHSAMAGTGAGLICFQHQHLHLYGGAGDIAACAGALGLMTAAGLFRMASDNHWASDVAVGYALGFAAGYGLPQLLHVSSEQTEPRKAFTIRVLPYGDASRVGLWALGAF